MPTYDPYIASNSGRMESETVVAYARPATANSWAIATSLEFLAVRLNQLHSTRAISDWLASRGIRGIREDCNECPLAELVYQYLHLDLRDYAVSVSGDAIEVYQLGITVARIRPSFLQSAFLAAFDEGNFPWIDAMLQGWRDA